jgi:hypothetical protein
MSCSFSETASWFSMRTRKAPAPVWVRERWFKRAHVL